MTTGDGPFGALRRSVVAAGAAVVTMLLVAVLAAVLGIVEVVARHTPFGVWTLGVAVAVGSGTGLFVWFRSPRAGSARRGAKPRPGAGTPMLIPWPESVPPEGAGAGSQTAGTTALRLKRGFLAALDGRDVAEAARLLAAVATLPGQEDWVASARRRLDALRSQTRRSRP
ncbi:hypothetical protein [Streptantibioticus ferralitis]|uniref:Uncharacterized protein n=1 Tax=Streptantibioticus ferralitis TaxID=236510 RepID=A0ABT5Z5B3_9ACTN|nr:hypothetical protein [Streptantibioticus ferralitis]MDF2258857.1 hypothetical protein [Streptantibioticus ferralitis]